MVCSTNPEQVPSKSSRKLQSDDSETKNEMSEKDECKYNLSGKSFTQKEEANMHVKTNTQTKPYACDYLGCFSVDDLNINDSIMIIMRTCFLKHHADHLFFHLYK